MFRVSLSQPVLLSIIRSLSQCIHRISIKLPLLGTTAVLLFNFLIAIHLPLNVRRNSSLHFNYPSGLFSNTILINNLCNSILLRSCTGVKLKFRHYPYQFDLINAIGYSHHQICADEYIDLVISDILHRVHHQCPKNQI